MSEPVSLHSPINASADAVVTGSLVVKTGLRELQGYSVTLAEAPAAGAAFVSATKSVDPNSGEGLLTISVWDSAYAPSVVATNVNWTALGK